MLNDSGHTKPLTDATPIAGNGKSNRKTIWTGDEFANAIRREQVEDWQGCEISGLVNLKGVTVNYYLQVRSAVFTHAVDFSQARFERGADFTGCRFQEKLLLSDAQVEGPLKLDGVIIGQKIEPLPDVFRLRLAIARLEEAPADSNNVETSNNGETGEPEQQQQQRAKRRAESLERLNEQLKAATAQLAKQPTLAEFDNLRVAGCLSLMRASIAGGVSCKHSDIENDLRLDEATISGNLTLRHASLGEIRTDWREFFSDEDEENAQRRERQPCRIGGQLDLTSTTITGDLRLIGITIGGQLSLQGGEIGGSLLCRADQHRNTWLMSDCWMMAVRVKGALDLSGARIGGDLNIQGGNIGGTIFIRTSMNIERRLRCRVVGTVWLLGVEVGGDVDFSGARISGDLTMQNAKVGQNLLAITRRGFQSRISQGIDLYGARVRGAAEFRGLDLRRDLNLDAASIDGGLVVALDLDEMSNWRVKRARVRGNITAESATIGKRVVLMGLNAGPTNHAEAHLREKEHGVNFIGAQINGEFALYSKKIILETIQAKSSGFLPVKISTEMEDKVVMPASRQLTVIDGSLKLTRAQVGGGIVLDGVTIEDDLDLRDASVRANISCQPIYFDSEQEPTRASVARADLETLNMVGDINLTGLNIVGKDGDADSGDLILRDANIVGRLELHPFSDELDLAGVANVRNQITNISGDLHLDAAQISHAIISGDNLKKKPEQNQPPAGEKEQTAKGEKEQTDLHVRVGLERGSIGRLQIVQPLPRPVDLSNLKVDRWDLPQSTSSYTEMLTYARPFKKSNFIAIEQHLRNTGDDERADEVHVLMRQQDRDKNKEKWGFWRKAFDWFLEHTIKYGTTSKRVVYVMLFWFALSVGFFMNRELVEHEVSAVSWSQPPAENSAPPVRHPVDWGLDEAILYSLHLHVPIISLGVKEDVQPSGTFWKAYAMTTVAASWIMWPLLIASASGFIRRRN